MREFTTCSLHVRFQGPRKFRMASHLLTIFGCKAHEDNRMNWQAETWPRRLPEEIEFLQMTGDGDDAIDSKGILRLSVADGYAELIDKTQRLFDWFIQTRDEPWLVKCDDDVWLSPHALDKIVANQSLYAGAYGFDYAGGPLYVLHRDAIAQLPPLRECMIDNNLAEDLALGNAARLAGIKLGSLGFNHVHWYNHLTDELRGQHNWDMAFAHTRDNHRLLMQYCESKYRNQCAEKIPAHN